MNEVARTPCVLHINTQDKVGGAGITVNRLHSRLMQLNVDSRMLVGIVSESDPTVALLRSPRQNPWDRVLSLTGAQYLFYLSSYHLPHHPWVHQSDIINLHNTHGGYFAHTILPTLSETRPVVWTMHDMWALTGHCSYSYECEKWRNGCGACPYLSEYPRLLFDTTSMLWRIKRAVYARSKLTLVSPSNWLANIARKSPLLARFPIHVIPNGIATEIYTPVQKSAARALLDLPPDRPLVLWTSDTGQEYRKGREIRERIVARFNNENRLATFVFLDDANPGFFTHGPVRILRRARVTSESEMARYYSAADLFVLPSRADNLPNMAIESLACGTPVAAFTTGGIPEIVAHMESGYLARAQDVDDLLNGIRLILDNELLRNSLSEKGRMVTANDFDIKIQARRYLELYTRILSENVHNQSEQDKFV